MGEQVAIAIGVRRAGNLVELPGAVNGARQFHDWAKQQKYRTYLVTDEKAPVVVKQLTTLIDRIIKTVQPDRLVLYFAGHGIQPSPNTAYWLLSRWDVDSNEAVNVNLSCHNAKRSGIGQIAVFADACRSTIPGGSLVGGSSIFPKAAAAAGKLPQWDHFLASRLDEIAQEVPAGKATEAYGIFSRCLMEALRGNAPTAIEDRPGKDPDRAVTSQRLADHLEDVVPLETGKIPGATVQFPEVVSGWRPERNFYLGLAPASSDLASAEKAAPRPQPVPPRARRAVAQATGQDEMAVRAAAKTFAASQGRESFETRMGLTIIGAVPTRFVVRGGARSEDLFEDLGAWHVRGRAFQPHSVMVALQGGTWLAACILPQFVGTVVVNDGLAASINYAPARGTPLPREEETATIASRWTALMHHGRYGTVPELTQVATVLRRHKHSNPSLGILAAYAYERAGLIEEVDDVAWWFAHRRQPIPFDVAMLSRGSRRGARRLGVRAKARPNGNRAYSIVGSVGGSFPLLTQGWSFLDPSDKFVHEALLALRGGLLPGLWTTFRADEGAELADLIRRGTLL